MLAVRGQVARLNHRLLVAVKSSALALTKTWQLLVIGCLWPYLFSILFKVRAERNLGHVDLASCLLSIVSAQEVCDLILAHEGVDSPFLIGLPGLISVRLLDLGQQIRRFELIAVRRAMGAELDTALVRRAQIMMLQLQLTVHIFARNAGSEGGNWRNG